MKFLLIGLIKFYQKLLGPFLKLMWPAATCRFYPTCSQYCLEAVEKRGVLKGVKAGCARILRCHPLSQGGFDPVV